MASNTLKYKGYTGTVKFDFDDGVLFGEVIDLNDVITFEGSTVAEVEQAFKDSIDDYLEFCAELGRPPEKPFSGKFVVRVSSELHKNLTIKAKSSNTSLNKYVEDILCKAVFA